MAKGPGPELGLSIDDEVVLPSWEDNVLLMELTELTELMELRLVLDVEFIVPVRDMEIPPMEMRASARSKTLPLNAEANDALCGVDGTVAWTAGPKAALCGVIGMGNGFPGRSPSGLIMDLRPAD